MTAREVGPESSSRGDPGAEARPLSERYRSLFVLGRGGMGSVEAALETNASDAEKPYERVVALKRLLPERRDARRVEMFLREAKLATMLDHPNVVRAHAYGEIEGELFLALEYVEGQPLSRVLQILRDRGEVLSPALAAHVLAEVCEGLHAAHELRGEGGQLLAVVHRDVSPQNVMIGYDGSVRLLDFGVAKIEAESVTKTGEVKGKTAYMSPEQAMGDPLDRRSDLFGVGAVLFECVAGKRMWGDGTDMDVIRRLALESPPALPAGGPALASLHAELVAREPAGRPATAREAGAALRAASGLTPEEGARELATLMTSWFGDDARTQREKLAAAIDEAAPGQAARLHASVRPPATSEEAPRSSRAIATASRAAEPPRSRTPLVALAAAAVVVAAWLALRPSAPPAMPRPEPAPPPTAETTTATTAVVPATTPPSASAKAPSEPTSAVVKPPSEPPPKAAPSGARRPAPPPAASSAPSTPAPPPRASASARVPPPPDVDPTPF